MAFVTFPIGKSVSGPCQEPDKAPDDGTMENSMIFSGGRMGKCQPAGTRARGRCASQKLLFPFPLSTVMVVDFVDNPPPYRFISIQGSCMSGKLHPYLVVPSCKAALYLLGIISAPGFRVVVNFQNPVIKNCFCCFRRTYPQSLMCCFPCSGADNPHMSPVYPLVFHKPLPKL